jgi:hypothetical protein
MKKDTKHDAEMHAQAPQSEERKKLKIKTSAQTGSPDPELPCAVFFF